MINYFEKQFELRDDIIVYTCDINNYKNNIAN